MENQFIAASGKLSSNLGATRRAGLIGAMALALSVAASLPSPALAQSFPSGSVSIVIPFAAGGTTDVLARKMAPMLQKKWGQPVIVENRPGAGSVVATQHVAKASPNGQTILLTDFSLSTNQVLMKTLPYDLDKDLRPVVSVAEWPLAITVDAKLGIKTLPELVEYSKKHRVNYGSFGIGTAPNLVMELFKSQTGMTIEHIPYKGVAPVFLALAAGEIQVTVMGAGAARTRVQNGDLIALGLDSKSDLLPNVPTFAQAGYPNMRAPAWWGIVAPRGTPDATVAALNQAFNEVLTDPGIKEFLVSQGYAVGGGSSVDMGRLIQESIALWGPVVKKANIVLE
ncbi:tripartite tricarboxylate transporter substrate binding protein [Comamonadaceae bacterium G21597-S1]|nr:tripartite tricarboxylate transporter substrate binding protein [Comamonadaceae bacterium G21597-S1]